jgi:hypothetical protein
MEEGWIKMFRRFLDWEWYGDTNMVRLFLHLLLKANFEDRRWRGMTIKKGQIVTSSLTLSEETHMSRQCVRTCLARLEQTGEILQKSTNKYTLITICKYVDYQGCVIEYQPTTNQQLTNNQPTTNQQLTNNQPQHKNIRKKELKNIYTLSNERESDAEASDPEKSSKESVDFVGLVKFFNRTMDQAKAIIPRCLSCEGKRREFVRGRIREHGIDKVYEMISKASESDFLNGKNERGWIADFTWLFSPSNFQKVLEGNYDNRTQQTNRNYGHTNQNQQCSSESRQAERERLAESYEATIARLAAEDDARSEKVRQP